MPDRSATRSVRFGCVKVACVCLLLSVGCDNIRQEPADLESVGFETPPAAANVVRVTRLSDVPRSTIVYGQLKPKRTARLGFMRGGIVSTVAVDLGDSAERGAVLAEIDQSSLEAEKLSLENRLAGTREQAANAARVGSFDQLIRSLETQLAAVEESLAQGRLSAPFDCIVADRLIDEGTSIGVGTPALQVLENRSPLIEAALPRQLLAELTDESVIRVRIDEAEFAATVRAVSPMEDSTAGRRTVMEFDSLPSEFWSFGTTVEVEFETATDEDGFWLPLSSLQRESEGLWSVLTVVNGQAAATFRIERRSVRTIRVEDDVALIDGALEDGALVVVDGGHRFVPGQAVVPTEVRIAQEFGAGDER